MAGRVFNAIGGTGADPCPTAIVEWLGTGYCNSNDYLAWFGAAGDMYEQGILPTYARLEGLIQAGKITAFEAGDVWERVDRYRRAYEALPTRGSILPSTNFERVTKAISLMGIGDVLISDMQQAIQNAGETPPALGRERPETPPEPKPSWQKYALPAAVGVFGLAVGGIIVYAVAKRD